MIKIKDNFEHFILKFGNMKNKDKAYLKSLVTLVSMPISLFISIVDLISHNYAGFAIYLLCFFGFFLMFLSFSSQYRMFKFLSEFSGGINEKKN